MCKSQESKTSSAERVHLLYIDTSKYAVLNFREEYKGYIFDKSCKPTALSADDIYKIEKIIKTKVDNYNKNSAHKYFFINNPNKYYKQFIAVINSKCEKEVWVNCFCEIFPSNFPWKTQTISVLDGGSCYFQLKINLTTNRVYDFGVNGVA
jgi:hypothetical protein